MLQLPRPLRLVALLVGVLALVLAVAACGGGGNSDGVASLTGSDKATATTNANRGKGNSQDKVQAARNWARCMRQHGINLPDPQITADGIEQQPPTGMDRNDKSRFKAAEQACGQFAPPGPPDRNSNGGGR